MSQQSIGIRFAYVLISMCLVAAPASAQAPRGGGPFAGLFGGRGDRGTALDARGSFFGAYNRDTTGPGDASTPVDPRFQQSGKIGGMDGLLAYRRQGEHSSFTASGNGSLLDYVGSPGLVTAVGGATSVNTALTPKISLDARAGATYSPYYQFAPFVDASSAVPSLPLGDAPVSEGSILAAVAQRNLTLDSGLTVTDKFSKRSSLAAEVHWQEFRFLDAPTNNVQWEGALVFFQHHFSRPFSFRLGYGRDRARYSTPTSAPLVFQTFDVGVDYADALKLARRTTLSFSTSVSALRSGNTLNYRLEGSATLVRAFARTWTAALAYNRGTNFSPGFAQPLLTDSVNASISGMIAPRLRWTSRAGYSRGTIGFSDPNPFTTYMVSSSLERALTQRIAVFGQYGYYWYALPGGSNTLQLLPRFSREIVVVGLSVWVPIIKQVRS